MPLLSWPFSTPSVLAAGTVSELGGTGSQNTDLTPGLPISYPGCKLILQVLLRSSPTVSCATPTNWTLITEDRHSAGGFGQWLFWAAHGESAPSVNWNAPDLTTTAAMARIYSIVNVDQSSYWYDLGTLTQATASSTLTMGSLTTRAAARLALGFQITTAQSTMTEPAGETGGEWFEEFDALTTLGSDGTIQLQSSLMPAAGTISGGTFALGISTNWMSRILGILPLADKRTEIAYTVNTSPRPQVILDSDIDSDVDDVVDLVFMLNLEAAGEVDIVSAVVTSAQIHAAPTMKAICNYYNRSALVIGANTSSQGASASLYNDEVAVEHPVIGFEEAADFPAAVTVIRQTLADADDKSIEYLSTGSLDTIKLLLESTGDGISPLSGIELVRRKIRYYWCVAGAWPQGAATTDFGGTGPRAVVSDAVLQNWPAVDTPIIFINLPDAGLVLTGANVMVALEVANPARFAWVSYHGNENAGNTRGAWSQVAILGLVRGVAPHSTTGTDWWRMLGRRGLASVNTTTGVTQWDFDTEGGHGWMRRRQPVATFVSTINALIQEPA